MPTPTCNFCHLRPAVVGLVVQAGDGQPRHQVVCNECLAGLGHAMNANSVAFSGAAAGAMPGAGARPEAPESETPALDQYGRDLTADAAAGRLDPVIGRDAETAQALEILTRRRKNNVALIGDPGVGKTALAEGIAAAMAAGTVPGLSGRRLIELDLAGMVAGAQYRGQFEARFKSVLEELKSSEEGVVLFIDELHTLVGAGAAEGAMDAANMLKPLLARGEIQLIGATTLDEYRKHIEADGALSRRFSTVFLDEPSLEDTVAILKGLREGYETHHGLRVPDDVVEQTVRLADRYLHEGRMPDKAVDLLDQAASRQRRLSPGGGDAEAEIARLENAKSVAIEREEFEFAADCKRRIEALRDHPRDGGGALEIASVTGVIASRTGIPDVELHADETARLRDLEGDLHRRVVGQDEAVSAVADAVRGARAGLSERGGPIGTFLFLGPTGVGKTELAKTLAERLFGSEDALLRIDMSEFREPHTVSRLVGSPPGYVGYGRGGELTEPVRRRPYRVILLDEIEKAHPDVWNLFLQVFDDGRLTDGEGRTVVFDDTVIIMTSNLGASLSKKRSVGFNPAAVDHSREAAERAFPPELWNRIDEVVTFSALDESVTLRITARMVDEIGARLLSEHGARLEATDAALERFATEGFSAEYGARPLARHLRRELTKPLVDAVLDGRITAGATVVVDVDGLSIAAPLETPAPVPA